MSQQGVKHVILPSVIGNLLEWYDFTLYGYFATIFAAHFFPSHEKFLSLLSAYGLFAASYFMRPVGAIFFGYIGDRYGRKYSLAYSIILMGICSLLVSILPTHAQWGMFAGVSLSIIRLLQGFAIGGEYSGASIFLIESAPPNKRSFYGSLAVSSAYCGFLLSSIVGAILSYVFTPEDLFQYGWRFGFVFGAVIALIGYYIRKKLKETAVFTQNKKQDREKINPLKNLLIMHPRVFLIALGIAVLPAGFAYVVYVYAGTFLNIYYHVPTQEILTINTIAMVFVVLSIPMVGWLADIVGRRKIMLVSAVAILIFCIPLFKLLQHQTLFALVSLALLNSIYEANIPSELASLFPPSYRYTGLALTLNLTFGFAGGLAPLISTILVDSTGILISPMFYVIGLSMITIFSLLICMRFLPKNLYH